METPDIDRPATSQKWAGAARRIEMGAHLVSEREGYTHHGIYAGNGQVIHYGGLHHCAGRRPVESISLQRFAAGRSISVRSEPGAVYTGADAVARAASRLGEDRYRLLTNNCEHFCTWCVRGVGRSDQVRRCIANPWVGIKTLFALARGFYEVDGSAKKVRRNVRRASLLSTAAQLKAPQLVRA